MTLPAFLRRSIDLSQAVAVLLASLIIGIALITVQLAYTFLNQRQAALAMVEEVLTLAEGSVTTASWTLDNELADDILHSLIALRDVQSATVIDEGGTVFAFAEREDSDYEPFTTWLADVMIGDSIRGERQLLVTSSGRLQSVGNFSVVLTPEQLVMRFIAVAKPVMVAGLIQALAIALVLLWLSRRLVTLPLKRAAKAVAEVDPASPQPAAIRIHPRHKDNELGYLLAHANTMIARLGSVQEQFRMLATHDPLTDLPNRAFVINRIEHALARAKRNGGSVAVLFIDLDGFKAVNDSHGHPQGDALLKKVAERLESVVRQNDTVGRLGGDEFLIVLEDLSEPRQVVPTVRRIEVEIGRAFNLETAEVRISCSIGIAMFPGDGADSQALMHNADIAMYQAKSEPGNNFHFFAPEMSERMQARINLEIALRQALNNEELRLLYQPKFDARSGALSGCEALLRWQRDGRLVPACDFIEVAEQAGIMVEIGTRVLDWACAQASDWAARFGPVAVAVNVSAQQLGQDDFPALVRECLQNHRLDASLLELEITETVLVKELDTATVKLQALRDAGCAIAIDDFGTGYSSLSYLTNLPASSLKIDRSFVSGSQSSDVVLDMIIAMAQALHMTTVAEGVETHAQRSRLVAKGCDELQGYLLGDAVTAEEFEEKFLSHVGAGSA